MTLNTIKRITTRIVPFICIGLIFSVFACIGSFSVNIPTWDEWDQLQIFDKFYSGNLTLSDFWHQHNEHRIFFSRIIILLLGIISGYDVRFGMYFSVFLSIIIFSVILLYNRRNRKELRLSRFEHSIISLVIAFAVFSPVQSENWFWGFQLPWYLNMLAVISGAYIFSSYRPHSPITFVLLAISSIVALLSLSNGVLFLVVILICYFIEVIYSSNKNRWIYLITWMIFMIGSINIYLIDYLKPGHHPSLIQFLEDPISFIGYVFAYVGAPVAYENRFIAVLFGGIGIILFGVIIIIQKTYTINVKRHIWYFFFIIATYSLLSAVLTAIGRAGLGIMQAMASRYATISIYFWISLLMMLYFFLKGGIYESKDSVKLRNIIIIFSTVLFISLNLTAIRSFSYIRRNYNQKICAVDTILSESFNDCLKFIYPNPQRLFNKDAIPFLKEMNLSFYRDAENIELPDLNLNRKSNSESTPKP